MIWFKVNLAQAAGDLTSNSLFHNTVDAGVEWKAKYIIYRWPSGFSVTDFVKLNSYDSSCSHGGTKICLCDALIATYMKRGVCLIPVILVVFAI